jgi:hypothetical protein
MAFTRVPGSGVPPAVAYYNDSDSFTIAGSNLNPPTTQSVFNALLFNPDGTKMYTLGYTHGYGGDKDLFQYTLSTPFDVSTASASVNDYIEVGEWSKDNVDVRFNNDGTKLFVLYEASTQNHRSRVYQYTLSVPYDITSTVTAGSSLIIGDQYDEFSAILFNPDGTKMFASRYGYIYKYTLNTPFVPTTVTNTDKSFFLPTTITGMQFNNDGTKLFTVYQARTIGTKATITEWALSTAYDPTTAIQPATATFVTDETTNANGEVPLQFMTFNNNGTKFFSFNGTNGDINGGLAKIKEWNLASAFSMSSSSSGSSGSASGPWEYDDTATESDTYPGSTRGANITISGGVKTYIKPVSGTAEQVYISTRKLGETKNRGELSKTFYDAQNAKGRP